MGKRGEGSVSVTGREEVCEESVGKLAEAYSESREYSQGERWKDEGCFEPWIEMFDMKSDKNWLVVYSIVTVEERRNIPVQIGTLEDGVQLKKK